MYATIPAFLSASRLRRLADVFGITAGATMRLMGLLYAVLGLLAFFCSLLPFARFENYALTVTVLQMGGVFSLLYFLPLALLVLGMLMFTGRPGAWRLWMLAGALAGLALSGWGARTALAQLGQAATSFQLGADALPVMAKGAWLSLISYGLLAVLLLLPRKGRRHENHR
ncbi:hypothetical protein [Amphibiibacter pelophylacis]|uniref:Uncharacterized protein n=1 Tax=Amphibiibacter pelophylacis TaxID=1799477 RepID=A0ACC6P0H9_9BURK